MAARQHQRLGPSDSSNHQRSDLGPDPGRIHAPNPRAGPPPALRTHGRPRTRHPKLVRVFLDDGTYCPGFQFLPGGNLHPTVLTLFDRAMELSIPHNYFTAWMTTPTRDLAGTRPVDHLTTGPAPRLRALESYRWR